MGEEFGRIACPTGFFHGEGPPSGGLTPAVTALCTGHYLPPFPLCARSREARPCTHGDPLLLFHPAAWLTLCVARASIFFVRDNLWDGENLLNETAVDERAKVERWREHVAVESGCTPEDAARFAASEGDLHRLVTMIEAGCDAALAVDILA